MNEPTIKPPVPIDNGVPQLPPELIPNNSKYRDFVSPPGQEVGRDWKPDPPRGFTEEESLNNVVRGGDFYVPGAPVAEGPSEEDRIRSNPDLNQNQKAQRLRRLRERTEKE